MKKLLLACMLALGMGVSAQTNLASYSFTKSTGATYTPITGGTVFISGTYDSQVSTAITMGGTFTYGGVAQTTCFISANGAITFGASSTSTTLLNTLGSTTGAIVAFGQDGASSTAPGAAPEIRYEDLGSEFVVQFTDHANYYNRATERLNFQIRLNYATGAINIVYGNCTNPGTASTSGTSVQVGVRGNSTTYATNVNNLMIGNIPVGTTCDWSNAVTGYDNGSTLLFSGTTNVNVKIPSGLQYTWSPGTQLPVRTFAAVSAITNAGATLTWTAPTGATSYNVQYRINGNCPWTDWSGNPVTGNTVSLTGLTQGTVYQVRVQALNGTSQSIYSHIPNAAGTGNGYVAAGTFTTVANCPSVATGLTAPPATLTPNSAIINWTAPASAPANGYEYYYNTANVAPTTTTVPSGVTGPGIVTANLTGLAPSTQYYYWVRTNCNGTDKGLWVGSSNFTTLGLCPTVSAPSANAVGQSLTPTITWASINGATGYKLNVGTTSGGSDIMNNVDLGNATTYTFPTPLNSATTYYYSVTAYTASSTGTACTIRNFTTLCNPVTALPWSENFDSMPSIGSGLAPICWSTIAGTKAWTSMNAGTTTYNMPRSAPNYMSIAYGNTTASQLWTPGFQLTAGTSYDFSFFYNTNGTSSSYIGYTGSVLVNTTATATGATNLGAFITATQGTAAYTKNTTTFVPATSGVYYFGLSVSSTSAPWYLGVDDFRLETTPTCVEPTNVTVDGASITTTGANINFTASTTAPLNGYTVYYSTVNTAPTISTVLTPSNSVNTTTSPATISGLTPSTTYYAWIRTDCSSSDLSSWAGPVTFTTDCVPVVAFAENFDTTTTTGNVLPNCWSKILTGASANAYVQASTSMSGPNVLYIYSNSATDNVYVKLPEVSSLSTGLYSLKFNARANFTAGGIMEIGYMTNAADPATFVVLGTYTASSATVIDTFIINITGVPAGVTTLAFRHTGVPANSILIDNVQYDLTSVLSTTNVKRDDVSVTVYPNPFTDIVNISDAKDLKSVSVVDMSGRMVKTIANPGRQINLSELKAGLYILKLDYKNGTSKSVKAIKK